MWSMAAGKEQQVAGVFGGVVGGISLLSVILAMVAWLLAVPAVAQSGAGHAFPNIQIANFGQINTNYYRGAQPFGSAYSELAAIGVKTVIDLRTGVDQSEAQLVREAGMKFYRIAMTTHEPPTSEQLAQFLSLVNNPANQPVYVHCVNGRHRTGIMTAAYRMTHDGWNADQAFKEMKQYKFGPDVLHPQFKRFVFAYHPSSAPAALSPGRS